MKFDVLIGQLVNLFRDGEPVRMSKRTGDIITLKEVIDEIGSDALRYILVANKHSQMIDFDLEQVKKQNKENPVFYIQYAFARINQILAKIDKSINNEKAHLKEITDTEKKLLLHIMKFKRELFYSATQLEPHHLANYLLDLAGFFHRFYDKNRVIDNGETIHYRVFIIQLAAKILKLGLNVLGIESPEKM